jgi:hypothetical protein
LHSRRLLYVGNGRILGFLRSGSQLLERVVILRCLRFERVEILRDLRGCNNDIFVRNFLSL